MYQKMFKLKVVLFKYLKEIVFRKIELIFDIEKIILKKINGLPLFQFLKPTKFFACCNT